MERRIRLKSGEHQVALFTNPPRIAEEMSRTSHGVTLQEAMDKGAHERHDQRNDDASWAVDAMTSIEPQAPQLWGDLTCEPIDTSEVIKARKLEIGDVRQMGVYHKVPPHEAQWGGHLGVGWVGAKTADGTHRPRFVAKYIIAYSALSCLRLYRPSSP